MEITQDQFTANLEQMPEGAQVQVVQLIEQNEPPVLQAFAASLGITLSMGENQGPMDSPDALEEGGGMGRLSPTERNIQEMQEFDNRTDPDPDPDPDLSDPMANVGQVTAPEAQPAASPMQDQMQQLALGDQVAGMIDQPGAEDQTGVADDVPMNAREGAFIVNAAAIAKVGKKDFEERIIEPAIEYLEEKEGIKIDIASITRPAQQVRGKQGVLASNREYYIPPELAEVIGTGLLEKINKRGEAETEKKLEEQEQQPQQQQQAAPPSREEAPVRAAKGTQVRKKKVDPKEQAKRKLRIRENDPLEKGTETTSTAKKLFSKEDFLTVGFGHRVVPKQSAGLFQTLFKVSPQNASRMANGKLAITRDQALKLFDRDYDTKEKDVIRRVGGEQVYKNLPAEIQGVFVDANFRGDFIKTNKEGKVVKQNWVKNTLDGDYAAASTEVLNHNELKANPKSGVAKRLRDYSKTLASFDNIPRPKRKPTPPAQQTQNSFMGSAPPIGSPEDERENLIAREQLEAATR